jgi:endoglucanase
MNAPRGLVRRRLLAALPAAALHRAGAAVAAPADGEWNEWKAFRTHYLLPEGRVVDTGNNGVSHSEGQGWGLFFAATAGDREAFDRMLGWTLRTLRRSGDALHAWRYLPYSKPRVPDTNNATDGDLFIAAALSRAARRWGASAYADAGAAIARDVLRLLVREAAGRTLLLPGAHGFETPDALVVNPSYYAFPLLDELAALVPSPQWEAVRRDGAELVEAGRFGQWMLPPDWLRVPRNPDAGLSPAPTWPARFSFDAIRVPLYAAWARAPVPDLMGAFARYWTSFPSGAAPAWVDLGTGTVAPFSAGPGMVAVARLATTANRAADDTAALPSVASATDYYGAALTLLARIAWRESGSA